MSNKEVETKIRITDHNVFLDLMKRMANECPPVEVIRQHDIYYTPSDTDFMCETYPYKWFRLRELDNGLAEICFKHFYPEGAEKHVYADEYEVSISDIHIMRMILDELHFRVIADVNKLRHSYRYGRYELSFDEVDGLGEYIEIELKDAPGDVLIEKANIDEVVQALGISAYPIELRGYPFIAYRIKSCDESF